MYFFSENARIKVELECSGCENGSSHEQCAKFYAQLRCGFMCSVAVLYLLPLECWTEFAATLLQLTIKRA